MKICHRWDGLQDWLRARGILYVPYHGLMLEGSECNRVLAAVDDLEQHLPAHLKPFASYLRSFGAVQRSTFGLVPQPSWQADIANMKAQFQQVVYM